MSVGGTVMIVMKHTTVLRGHEDGQPRYVPLESFGIMVGTPDARHARFIGYVSGLTMSHIAEGSPLSNQGVPKT